VQRNRDGERLHGLCHRVRRSEDRPYLPHGYSGQADQTEAQEAEGARVRPAVERQAVVEDDEDRGGERGTQRAAA
jgi:hypothetical protein